MQPHTVALMTADPIRAGRKRNSVSGRGAERKARVAGLLAAVVSW